MGGPAGRILIVDDDRHLREQIVWSLKADYAVTEASDRPSGLAALRNGPLDLVLLDLHMPPGGGAYEGMRVLQEVRDLGLDTLVIVMTGDESNESPLLAVESGAYDFFHKPVELAELKVIMRRALEKQRIDRENRRLREQLRERVAFPEILGQSAGMRRVFDAIKRVAGGDTTVIIRGESGTGKELVARAVHDQSDRRDGPFVALQCSALPENLIESELFGHEKGAFTGAIAARRGRFEMAHGGTLFLDEIGTLSPLVQSKLLRVLEGREFERLGGKQTIRVDVRLITATNEDLESRVRQGGFREDLYYRINVFPIVLPPLRERREDIPALVDHYLRIFCKARGIPAKTVEPEALARLARHAWKGNVRELVNVVQTLVLTTDGGRIAEGDLPPGLGAAAIEGPADGGGFDGRPIDLPGAVERFERQLLEQALKRTDGVKVEAARLLGIDKNQMMYLSRKHRL